MALQHCMFLAESVERYTMMIMGRSILVNDQWSGDAIICMANDSFDTLKGV